MVNEVKVSIKIKALIALAMPVLYYLMFLPVWNGNEFKINNIDIIDIIQIASFIIALISVWKDVKNQTIFSVVRAVSAFFTCFFGIFFVEKLMGIPLFPLQD